MRGQCVESVRVNDHGDLGPLEQPEEELNRFLLLAHARSHGDDRLLFQNRIEERGFEVPAGDFALIAFQQGKRHQLRRDRGDGGQYRLRDGRGDQARAGA